MAFRIKAKETVAVAVKRVIREQIGKAEAELGKRDEDLHHAIHQSRKRCKKVRALYRLVRPALPEGVYARENARFRDAARELAPAREAEAMVETYDALLDRFGEEERRAYGNIRRQLSFRRQALVEGETDLEGKIARFEAALRDGRAALEDWELEDSGFAGAEGGLKKTYKRGRKAMRAALEEPTSERFHEWRKRVKYHRFHTRMLRELWRPMMEEREDQVDALGERLGDEHDLAELKELLHREQEAFGRKADLERFFGLMERRRLELRREAWEIGDRVFACKPKRLVKRFRAYWEAWRREREPLLP